VTYMIDDIRVRGERVLQFFVECPDPVDGDSARVVMLCGREGGGWFSLVLWLQLFIHVFLASNDFSSPDPRFTVSG
jgi:hypothetical protein